MKKLLTLAFTTSLMVAGCATADNHDKGEMAADAKMGSPTIEQAEADLNEAIAMKAQWRIIDKSTGSKAVDLSKLLEVAKEKAAAGEAEEAERIAMLISKTSKISIDQQKRYAGALPRYN